MRTQKLIAAVTIAAATAALTLLAAPPSAAGGSSSTAKQKSFLVLGADGASRAQTLRAIADSGGKVVSENRDIGLYQVRSRATAFASTATARQAVTVAAPDTIIGSTPQQIGKRNRVEQEHRFTTPNSSPSARGPNPGPTAGMDPLDTNLWGLRMVRSDFARTVNAGDDRVRVGILDSGIDVRNPDLKNRVDLSLSRNFTKDIPEIDGPCEFTGCVDPVGWDDSGHGTHVSGTVAAEANGLGVSGVAPNVTLVEIRGGQDSGFLFLKPVADALTYGGDIGLDVINMSFYVDPWLYNCRGGAPEDDAAEAAHQELVIKTMKRALNYAHRKGVTLVGSLGNNNEDISNPRVDTSSPDFPLGSTHPRTIDDSKCIDLPVEGPHVIGVSALGPSERKADYSNYTTSGKAKGEIEVSAPGGWFRDGFGTPTFRTVQNEILSTYPVNVLQAVTPAPYVDAAGEVTPAGVANGVMKQCPAGAASFTDCGYYAWLQGTSMASPHVTGVAALAVSAWGKGRTANNFGLAPDRVRDIVMSSARDHACPVPPLQSYVDVGRDASYDALCVGTPAFNGFYGDGIVDAYAAVTVGAG